MRRFAALKHKVNLFSKSFQLIQHYEQCCVLHPDPVPGAGEFLELDQVDLCELLSRVLVQGSVLLHSPVQSTQLDQFCHHSYGWDPLDHQVIGL